MPPERVAAIVDQLMGSALWSGWGVRTMSADDAGFNPLSYHNGTVWPHDNSLIAWGLARQGRWQECHQIVRRMLDAAAHFDWQLPEVFAGLDRAETPFPIAYPTAARPQAWAAGTPVLLLQLLLGLVPDRDRHRLLTVAPELPTWAGELRVSGHPGLRPPLGRDRRGRPGARRGVAVRIAVVAPAWFPVPPTGYGGIEWVVWLLAEGLVEAGHDVTLFAAGQSRTKAKLEYVFAEAPSEEIGRTFPELHHLLHCYSRQDEFDLINDHTGLMGASVGGALRTPVAHTVHGPVDGDPRPPLRPGRRSSRRTSG